MSAERPWLKFYPQDWRADERLRNCTLAARGLWVEMLALMHRSERYGYLLINGRTPTERQLANQVGAATADVSVLLAELEAEAVFSRETDGTIFSRRMKRDEEKHTKASNFGKQGVRVKALKEKDKEGTLKGRLKDTHEDTLQLRGQRPEARRQKDKPFVGATKCSIPDDWEPCEFGKGTDAKAITDGWPPAEHKRQAELFRAHHERDGSQFKNWQSAWATWVLNSARFAERDRKSKTPAASNGDAFMDAIAGDYLPKEKT